MTRLGNPSSSSKPTALPASQRLFVTLLFSLSLSFWTATTSTSTSPLVSAEECTVEADGSSNCQQPELECGVYMAPSTLGEDTNMGIYTGKTLRKNDVVNFPEIAVPLQFREWGEHKEGYEGKHTHTVYLIY
jgi:hypothetical protein